MNKAEQIERAIKHYISVLSEAQVVLDSGFGNKPNESNTVYKNRKLYAELAIKSLQQELEREKNEPLTLEQLEGMVGKPVYAKSTQEWFVLREVFNGDELEFNNCIADYQENEYYEYEKESE